MAYIRPAVFKLEKRLKEPIRHIQVVLGPRQVGKTTGVRQVLDRWKGPTLYDTADLPVPPTVQWVENAWMRARIEWQSSRKPVLLALDEVQKVPRWSETVKRFWDEDRHDKRDIRPVLLGSSAVLVAEGLAESLAGRFETLPLGHWDYEEMRDAFKYDLDTFLFHGGCPGAASLAGDFERYRAYIQSSLIEPALSRDVLMGARIDKPALLKRLFAVACGHAAEEVSYTKLLGQLQDAKNTVTLASYQELLARAWLVVGLSKWAGNVVRRRGSSPKWLPLNNAFLAAHSDDPPQAVRSRPEQWGRWVENAVGARLFSQAGVLGGDLYWWRKGHDEVDYVVKAAGKLVAVEVKSGRPRAGRPGLDAFRREWPSSKGMLVGGSGIPLKDFFETPLSGWLKAF